MPIAHEIIRPDHAALRKNPFTLEEMAKVKIATSGVDLESFYLPTMIKELKKYQDFNKIYKSIRGVHLGADWQKWQYYLTGQL